MHKNSAFCEFVCTNCDFGNEIPVTWWPLKGLFDWWVSQLNKYLSKSEWMNQIVETIKIERLTEKYDIFSCLDVRSDVVSSQYRYQNISKKHMTQ